MSLESKINPEHLKLLYPLKEWRVLDLASLLKKSDTRLSQPGLVRLVLRLEKANIIKGFRDPWSRKKYVYLTKLGEELISLNDNPTAISQESLFHDLRVVDLGQELIKNNVFKKIRFEHQIVNRKNYVTNLALIPDAEVDGVMNGKNFSLAIELELHQKSKDRLEKKGEQYLGSLYDHCLFMFSDKNTLENYKKFFTEKLGPKFNEKIFLFHLGGIYEPQINLQKTSGFVFGKWMKFNDVFC
jgi:DNA-binding MarR family transcriptional regulator